MCVGEPTGRWQVAAWLRHHTSPKNWAKSNPSEQVCDIVAGCDIVAVANDTAHLCSALLSHLAHTRARIDGVGCVESIDGVE